MSSEQQQRIMGYFIEEAKDHLNTIEQGLLNLQSTIEDPELISEVFRAAHSVKGGAAMLGIDSVQQMSHRLEDCFKILKERPVQVDQRLESLFLQVFDALKALIEQLQSPFGLTDQSANQIVQTVTPVVAQLQQHLNHLLRSDEELPLPEVRPAGSETLSRPEVGLSPATQRFFQAEVPERLRHMLQLFKQPDSAEGRYQLDQCCQQLLTPSRAIDLPAEWLQLVTHVQRAIAYPTNTYRQLAPIIIKNLKRAQEAAVSGRPRALAIGDDLQALLPSSLELTAQGPAAQESELDLLLADGTQFEGEPEDRPGDTSDDLMASLSDEAMATEEDISAAIATDEAALADLDLFSDPDANLTDVDIADIDGLADLFDPEPSGQISPEPSDATAAQAFDGSPDSDQGASEEGRDELDALFGADTFDADASDASARAVSAENTETDAAGLGDDSSDQDDLSALLAMQDEPQADQLVSALSDTADSDLDELFGDLLAPEDSEERTGESPEAQAAAQAEMQTEPASVDMTDTAAATEAVPGFDRDFDRLEPPEAGTADRAEDESALDDLFAEPSEPDPAPVSSDADLDLDLDSDLELGLDADAPPDSPSDPTAEDDLDLLLADDQSPEPNREPESDEFSSLFESPQEAPDSPPEDRPDGDRVDEGLDNFFSSLEPGPESGEAGDGDSESDGFVDDDFDLALGAIADEAETAPDDEAVDGEAPDVDAADEEIAARDADAEEITADATAFTDIFEQADDAASAEEELGFDVSTVDVTEDVWGNEADDAPDDGSENTGSENPFDDGAISLEEVDLNDEPTERGLDQLFDDLDPLPDVFSSAPLDFADDEDPAIAEAVLPSPEGDTLQDSATSDEGNASNADPAAALSTDSPDAAAAEGATEDEPFSLDDLMTAEAALAADLGLESDRGAERFDDWAVTSSEAADPEPQESLESPEPSSEFDDLLSIGRSEPADAAEVASSAEPTSPSNDREDLGSDLDSDLGNGPGESPQERSDDQRYRAEDVADVFLDLDTLLGDTDADIQADLLAMEPVTTVDQDQDDLAEPHDVGEADLEYPDQEIFGGTEEIEAAIQELEDGGEKADLPLGQIGDGPQNADDFADLEKLLEQADETLGGTPMPGTALRLSSPGRRPARRPTLGNQTMRVSVKNLDNLNNLVGELVVNRNSLEQSQDRLRQFLDNLMSQVQQLGDLGQRVRDLYERSLLESSLRSSRPQQTISFASEADDQHITGARFDALEMDRFTGFHSLSQEIIELIVRVREAASDIDFIVDESDQGTRMLRQITTQLQEGINHTRMVPFAQAADRLPRAVRDISVKFSKQAELVVEGRDTLVDKMILEQLYDPMTHLVNNAITHGIEQPEARMAAGKSPIGKITVRAFHQGNQTIISVTDDGAGIDAHQVKQKAQQRGLISPQEAETMTQLDTYDLLFHHGFSTRDQADDFAGRGVGMDVVRTSLSEVRGTVNIDSTVGQGTTFTIRLPLTLSISKALLCVSDRARIAFPMDGVEDMFDIPQDRVQKNSAGQTCIPWRETLLPFRPLSNLLRFNRTIGRGSVYGGSQDDDMISIVVLRSAGNYLALQVDQVLEEREIVIKQLEPPVPKPAGIAGATVLGDGRVMPITDVLELVDLSLGRSRRELAREEEPPAEEPPTEEREPTVLIVDDSITVRELLSMTFAKVGYRVEQARDGQEAWEKLKSGLPCDLVFCDIEMPRMDGLELLSRLQRDPDLETLPVAMLTSRGADRHRQMAVELGAKGYFTKPYLEEALLEAAHRMLTGEGANN